MYPVAFVAQSTDGSQNIASSGCGTFKNVHLYSSGTISNVPPLLPKLRENIIVASVASVASVAMVVCGVRAALRLITALMGAGSGQCCE